MKKINCTCWACVEGERLEREAREGGGGKAMDGGRKKERENRRYENGLRRERERSGKKEYKGWKRVEKEAKEGEEFPGKKGRVEGGE